MSPFTIHESLNPISFLILFLHSMSAIWTNLLVLIMALFIFIHSHFHYSFIFISLTAFLFYGLTSTVSLNKLSYSCSAFCWHFKSSSFILLFTSPHLVSFHFISSSHLFYEEIAIAIAYERMGINFYQAFFNDLHDDSLKRFLPF